MKKSILIVPLVLILAFAIAVVLVKTKPKRKQKPREEHSVYVHTQQMNPISTQVTLRATGTVAPAREISLQARISGEVISTSPNFEAGGTFTNDQLIVSIDPADYEIAVISRQAECATAELAYANELGMQDIAQHEWELIDNRESSSDLEKDLVLRRPHLAKAEAALAAAKAALSKAELDLQRTKIAAPFNAVIMNKQTELGAQVSPQTSLAVLAGTDEYYVDIALPVSQLKWLQLPDQHGKNGSPAVIRQIDATGTSGTWQGSLTRVKPDLEDKGRLAQLTISIPAPLETETDVPLLLGTYVEVELLGQNVEDIFIIPREHVQDGGFVWTKSPEQRLHIQPVEIIWSDRDIAVVKNGITAGDELIISDIPAPSEGLLLQEANAKPGKNSGE